MITFPTAVVASPEKGSGAGESQHLYASDEDHCGVTGGSVEGAHCGTGHGATRRGRNLCECQ